ncbi:phage tail protein, partial [Pectobacterium versatile]|nr:phage tail protein [Pectobacterium versatile]
GFDSFMDEVSFIPARRDLGEDQYQLAVMKFDAVLSWERWPYRVCDPRNLCALLLVWQEGQDDVPYMDAGLDM